MLNKWQKERKLIVLCTADKFELPLFVGDSLVDISDHTGCSQSSLCHHINGRNTCVLMGNEKCVVRIVQLPEHEFESLLKEIERREI